MRICKCCGQTVPDQLSLVDRVVGLLARSDRPLTPRAIREALASGEGTTAQTLRRLNERGIIRRSTHPALGSGWIITPGMLVEEGGTPGLSASELADGQEMLESALRDLVAYVGATGRTRRSTAEAFLMKQGCVPEVTADLIALAVDSGEILVEGEELVAP